MKLWLVLALALLCACQPVAYQAVSPLSPVSPLSRGMHQATVDIPPSEVSIPVKAASAALTHNSWLPLIASIKQECNMGNIAQQLATLFKSDPGQQRKNIICDPALVKAAQHRADDMNARQYFGHTDPDDHTPNFWARHYGCNLPSYYPTEGNQIESIALNYPSAKDTWQAWLNSSGHRVHVLGADPFFAEQIRYGIGYSPGPWGIVYVILTSPTC